MNWPEFEVAVRLCEDGIGSDTADAAYAQFAPYILLCGRPERHRRFDCDCDDAF